MLGLDLQPVASSLGLSESEFLFGMSFLAALPLNWVWGRLPHGAVRHLYGIVIGASIYVGLFGWESLEMFVPAGLVYVMMRVDRKRASLYGWLIAFPYLIYLHFKEASGSKWGEGVIDYTAAAMVLTLKVLSCAMCFQDGIGDKDKQTSFQKMHAIQKTISPLEYLGYCVGCTNLLAGPYIEISRYLNFCNGEGQWKDGRRWTGQYKAGLSKMLFGVVACGLHAVIAPVFPSQDLASPAHVALPVVQRFAATWTALFALRCKYYFAWYLADSANAFSGLSYTRTDKGANWDQVLNVHPLQVEWASSSVLIPTDWNVQTGEFLRHYVYERSTLDGAKPGALSLILAQTVASLWHGISFGYWVFFITSAIWILAGKAVYKLRLTTEGTIKTAWGVYGRVLAIAGLNSMAVNFVLLDVPRCWVAYKSVFFLCHVLVVPPLAAKALGSKPRRASAAKKAA
ncbi:unnamed protein product [Pedinophyceae sp. YPF-701]|nr:unnamed protein product [Pedinophyceae sp. YPF-701]